MATRLIAAATVAIVVAVVVAAFLSIGPPSRARAEALDRQRLRDLGDIAAGLHDDYRERKTAPAGLRAAATRPGNRKNLRIPAPNKRALPTLRQVRASDAGEPQRSGRSLVLASSRRAILLQSRRRRARRVDAVKRLRSPSTERRTARCK